MMNQTDVIPSETRDLQVRRPEVQISQSLRSFEMTTL